MNIDYLNSLPGIPNVFGEELQEGERVVFTSKLSTFGTERDTPLGQDCRLTITDKRLLVNNDAGIWSADLETEVVSCKKVTSKVLFIKVVYFEIMLSEPIVYDNGQWRLMGFHFYFSKQDQPRFEEFANKLFE